MRPVCAVAVDGFPSASSSSSYPGPVSVSEMSLLHALGPVQTWLGQELEKCGIDAMIYTRYVLSLLLHDSCDYDLQEQVFAFCKCSVKAHNCVCVCAFFLPRVLSYSGAGRRLWSRNFEADESSHRAHRLMRSLSLRLSPCSGRLWILSRTVVVRLPIALE